MDGPDLSALWAEVERQFELGPDSIHGPAHWRRVEAHGLRLAPRTGADVLVVRLFAVLHDARREDDGGDPGHGARAATYAAVLRGRFFTLDDARFAQLAYACTWHDRGRVSDHPTIGTCWDADRLDLVRIGIPPRAVYMSTAAGQAAAGG